MTSSRGPLVVAREVDDWPTLREALRDTVGWVFRGVQSVDWPLQSSLERYVVADTREATEQMLLERYQSAAANYLSAELIPRTLLDWHASMQHHGAPTRLLDCTRSPYVAAYFAVEDAVHVPGQIWAFNEKWFSDNARKTLKSDVGLTQWIYGDSWVKTPMAAIAGPSRMSQRQIAQQSAFLIPGDVSLSLEENIRSMSGPISAGVRRYIVPHPLRNEMLRDLRLMNISRASLFPGLDGFAQSLRYELVGETPSVVMQRAFGRTMRAEWLKRKANLASQKPSADK